MSMESPSHLRGLHVAVLVAHGAMALAQPAANIDVEVLAQTGPFALDIYICTSTVVFVPRLTLLSAQPVANAQRRSSCLSRQLEPTIARVNRAAARLSA